MTGAEGVAGLVAVVAVSVVRRGADVDVLAGVEAASEASGRGAGRMRGSCGGEAARGREVDAELRREGAVELAAAEVKAPNAC